jgi:hypothetical protein
MADNRMMLSPSSALAEQAASVAAAMARRDPQEEIEYNVELRGLAELPDWKGALLAVHHRSLDVSNGPPFIVKKLLRPGDAFDDQSIRGGYVRLELLRVEAKTGSARVRANKTEFTVGMDDPAQPALAQNDAPLALIFKEPLEFYGELTERTILCHPTLKTNVFPFAARARDRTEAIRILEQALREHGIVIAYESEHFALALPVNLVKSVTAQLRAMEAPAWSNRGEEEILAKGSILMENASLDQVMGLYGALAGRKWVGKDAVSCHPLTVHSQTPLSKAETLHALDILLLWNGLRTVPVGNNDFRIARLPRH